MSNIDWWRDYSPASLNELSIVLDKAISILEKNERRKAIKLPFSYFENIGEETVLSVLENLSDDGKLFKVLNRYHKKLLNEVGFGKNEEWFPKSDILKDAAYRLGFKEDDLKEFALVEIISTDSVNSLREIKEKVDGKQASITKAQAKRQIAKIKKTIKLGKQEAVLLTLLSDLEPHFTKSIENTISTNYKKLKSRLENKLASTDWKIHSEQGAGHKKGFYQLEYFPQLKKKTTIQP